MTDASLHARATEVFLGAVELEAARRSAYLDQACAEDADLRREVESLLRHHRVETLIDHSDVASRLELARPRRADEAPWQLRRRQRRRLIGASAVALALLLIFAAWIDRSVGNSIRTELRGRLEGVLESNVQTLQSWVAAEQAAVRGFAENAEVRLLTEQLYRLSLDSSEPTVALDSPVNSVLVEHLRPLDEREHSFGLAIMGREGGVLAHTISLDPAGPLPQLNATGAALYNRIYAGETIFRGSFSDRTFVTRTDMQTNESLVAVGAPVRGSGDRVVAALFVRSRAEAAFTSLLASGILGRTGESYAFGPDGVLYTDVRDRGALRGGGLIGDAPAAREVLAVSIRDPGGDLAEGFRNPSNPETWPLTRMARRATAGEDGIDLAGYRNYRGVKVVGAWRWLPDLDLGIATEIEFAEAYASLAPLRMLYGALLALVTLLVGGVLLAPALVRRLRDRLVGIQRVGPYVLGEQIGQGGMGVVHLAEHVALKRPTALKILPADQVSAAAAARFEREVRKSAELSHPNTISVYDYGRTRDGSLYYAMEYVPGVTLSELVMREGPLPPARVVVIIAQACRSVREAHQKGLIHRDLKPGNLMLCRRAGEADVLKILDFGLVMEMSRLDGEGRLGEVLGSPPYVAPEALGDPGRIDARADLYCLGAVAFYLLTGRAIIEGENLLDLCARIPEEVPPALSALLPGIPRELDALVGHCLEKDPGKRPQSADELLEAIEAIELPENWGSREAWAWWNRSASWAERLPSLAH